MLPLSADVSLADPNSVPLTGHWPSVCVGRVLPAEPGGEEDRVLTRLGLSLGLRLHDVALLGFGSF